MDNKSIETLVKTETIRKKVVSVDPTKDETVRTITMTDGPLIPKKGEKHLMTSWRITFFLALAVLLFLVIFRPDPYREIFIVCIKGAPVTFEVTIFAIIGAVFIGVFTGLGSVSKHHVINMISGVYVEFIRGIPLLVQLIFIYYALGRFFHIEGMIAAIIALSICFGAYMGEIVRAGIQ
ncbi:MAG: ABC transporter permease subunit, partial [Bullifex sp.]|nr:ABC transporter permease subunit [Spirochaetales bacterium]MDY5778060.1 ABC transporter permease subunit [Bullifex sp.]